MNPAGITQDDIQALRKSQSRSARFATFGALPLLIVLFAGAGAINLLASSRLAEAAGMSLVDVIRGWFAGIDPTRDYTGIYLKALDRWVASITTFALAVVFVFVLQMARRAARRNARILKFVEAQASLQPSAGLRRDSPPTRDVAG